jgi:hypothetical protein
MPFPALQTLFDPLLPKGLQGCGFKQSLGAARRFLLALGSGADGGVHIESWYG